MKKLLLFLLVLGGVGYLLTASGDVRSVIGWVLTAYLVIRAFPAVKSDVLWLARAGRLRSLRYRHSKVDTL